MLDSRILSHRPDAAMTEVLHYDDADDTVHIETVQDVELIIEANKREYNDAPTRMGGAGFVKIGSIPMTVYYDLKRRGILDDQKALAKWLNDPSNQHFRTRPGRV